MINSFFLIISNGNTNDAKLVKHENNHLIWNYVYLGYKRALRRMVSYTRFVEKVDR